jgi:predicted alpha/beta hydrolase family esterase
MNWYNTVMKNAIILHGTGGSPDGNWFPWLKKELEKKGYSVWVPELPGNDYPNRKTYTEFLLKNAPEIDSSTIIIGHSSGAVAILGLLQALPKDSTIKAAYLVAGFKDNLRWVDKKGKHVLGGLFEDDYDWTAIKKKAGKFILIQSDNDPYVPMSHGSYLSIKLDGALTINPKQKHFSIETKGDEYKEFPFLLEMIMLQSGPPPSSIGDKAQ